MPMSEDTLAHALTTDALAERLLMLAHNPREFTPDERAAFLREAARRLTLNLAAVSR